MAITISSSFDAGNIKVVSQDGDRADLEIVKDHLSDFYQWFYFRVAGAAGREVTLRITNCAGSAYPHGWPDYKGVMSLDREEWVRITDTSYANGVLTMNADRVNGKPERFDHSYEIESLTATEFRARYHNPDYLFVEMRIPAFESPPCYLGA